MFAIFKSLLIYKNIFISPSNGFFYSMFLFTMPMSSLITKSMYPIYFYLINMFIYNLYIFIMKDYTTDIYLKYIQDFYYNNTINKNLNIKPNSKKLIVTFPHGLVCIGYMLAGSISYKMNFKKCVSILLFYLPLIGDYIRTINFTSCKKTNVISLMKKKENIMLLPGGFNELYMTCKYEYNIFIPYGFISLAIRYNYTIIPILSLGENETFDCLTLHKRSWHYIKYIMKYITVPLIIPYKENRIPVINYQGEDIVCNKDDDVYVIHSKIKNSILNLFKNNIKEYVDYRNNLNVKPIVKVEQYTINIY